MFLPNAIHFYAQLMKHNIALRSYRPTQYCIQDVTASRRSWWSVGGIVILMFVSKSVETMMMMMILASKGKKEVGEVWEV